MLQNATPLRISDEHVSCTVPALENASCQILVKCPTPAVVFGNATKPSPFAHSWQGAQSLAPAPRNDIWTSKSAPSMVWFVHFDLEMCFAPQRRALVRHLNFQKCSEHGVICTFWLGYVLRATTARTFSTSQLPKVFWAGYVLYILTWKRASRHSSVHFFDISTSKSAPRLTCFVHFDFEMCFAPQRRAIFHLSSPQTAPHPPLWRGYFSTLRSHKSLEKQCWLCYLFAHLHLLSSHSFSSLIFSLLLFSSRTLPTSAFPSVHIVGSLTSKLPSICCNSCSCTHIMGISETLYTPKWANRIIDK